MLGWLHLPVLDFGSGALTLTLLGAGAALAIAIILIVATFRRSGGSEVANALWGAALVLIGGVLASVVIEYPRTAADTGGERRSFDRQAAELTARAIAPGSALACLDAVPGAVADACEKAVFAKPEALAAAVDYIDARLSLLALGTALAEREPSLEPALARLRGALEADRFGLVAHVLTTRGCSKPDCADLKLLRDPARVLANMAAHTFEAHLGTHALAWQDNGIAATAAPSTLSSVAAPLPPAGATSSSLPAAPMASSTSGSANGAHFDFPSAASIPPVSIMAPEPPTPSPAAAAPQAKPVALPPKRPPQPKRQTAHEQASATPATARRPAAAPPQPTVAPSAAPSPPAATAAPEPEPATPDPLPSHRAY